jgi:hypothetical protein
MEQAIDCIEELVAFDLSGEVDFIEMVDPSIHTSVDILNDG